jgi:hypothetical protein
VRQAHRRRPITGAAGPAAKGAARAGRSPQAELLSRARQRAFAAPRPRSGRLARNRRRPQSGNRRWPQLGPLHGRAPSHSFGAGEPRTGALTRVCRHERLRDTAAARRPFYLARVHVVRTVNLSVFRRHPYAAPALGSVCKSGGSFHLNGVFGSRQGRWRGRRPGTRGTKPGTSRLPGTAARFDATCRGSGARCGLPRARPGGGERSVLAWWTSFD